MLSQKKEGAKERRRSALSYGMGKGKAAAAGCGKAGGEGNRMSDTS